MKAMTAVSAEFLAPRLQALADENDGVREAATSELRQAGASTRDIVDALLEVMRKGEYYTSMQAAAALAGFGQIAIPALTEALSFTSYGVAGHAAEAIGQVEDPAAVPELIDLVERGLESAIEALGGIAKPAAAAVPLLIQVVERRTAHDDSAPYVTSGSPRSMAWEAAEALGRIGDARAVNCLLDMLQDANARSRWTAAEALGRIGDSAARSGLRAASNDQDPYVRKTAQAALVLLTHRA
jgi:HEAT repeat protein